ncbi:MAG TPA: SusC/RagA family TonB-linked outer membrane protein [Flavobacteriales bacterium]|nr:SusC/RagA family TonB-linked outer membrane protein [Flavobacteriales bacterium]HIB78021.1 SusC/RagA family TonB-linked outer membrane protein [Flavobacteriales bacterium]HIN41020.1 SusC/RagA family TonB-linked outer membrane protein [Flavobacteriales bacterium]
MKAKMLVFMTLLFSATAWSQSSVSGTVTDKASGEGMPGVGVIVDGSGQGVYTGLDGTYSVTANPATDALTFSFIGYTTLRVALNGNSTVNVALERGVELDEVVVTALGVSREKKALGYSVQELGADAFSGAKTDNIVRSLSGKVAGVQVTSGTSIGSSSKILLRGASSITGDNQPLFVVNGVPMDNSDYSSTNTQRSVGGYDYGNAIQDINPDDIESVTILKGAAAAALYGSRASNGAIVITTKSGKGYQASGRRGLGISVHSGVAFNNVYILPDYQNRYGGGAGTAWIDTVDGAFIPDYGYDGSWGAELLGQDVRHWDSWDEGNENFGEVRGWNPTDSDVDEYFQTGVTYTNSFAVTGATDESSFRLSYTKRDQTGVYENSSLNRNTLSFSGSADVSDKLTASANVNYVQSVGKGRPQTGYGSSIMSQFTQWGQRQLSMDRLRDYMNADGTQRTWNRNSASDGAPHYWDNPFWERYMNVQDDQRDRVYGNVSMNYTINENLSVTARAMTDFYTDRRQERIAVGGVNESKYSEYTRQLQENNLDLYLNFNRELSDELSMTGFVGVNKRTRDYNRLGAYTLGGLNTPGLYTVTNGVDGYQVSDYESHKQVNSVLGSMSFGYNSTIYVDITGRNDISSTLPDENNSYFYPSATASYIFSEAMESDVVSFGKLRLGWAQVGNDTDPYETGLTYGVDPNYGSSGSSYVPNAQNNPNLRPEKTTSFEAGIEMNFFMDRLRLDMTYYDNTTEDLIFNVPVSASSGYTSAVLNAGKTNNRGVELALSATPVMTDNFRWDISLNVAKNRNELIELADGVENIRYTSLFGVTLEARPGQPLGTFYGYDFLYDDDGNKLVDADGYYLSTDEVVPIGSILPDHTGGLYNAFTFGNVSFSALIDFQKGGSLHSYSNQWGKYSGTLAETIENNIREDGIVVDGMLAEQNAEGEWVSTGEANSANISAGAHFFYNQGYIIHAADQYDASFVKLRELRLDYDLPADLLGDLPFYNISLGVYGRNLAILSSNAPHIDPEVTTSASNIQGFEGGQLPAERTIGFNLKLTL